MWPMGKITIHSFDTRTSLYKKIAHFCFRLGKRAETARRWQQVVHVTYLASTFTIHTAFPAALLIIVAEQFPIIVSKITFILFEARTTLEKIHTHFCFSFRAIATSSHPSRGAIAVDGGWHQIVHLIIIFIDRSQLFHKMSVITFIAFDTSTPFCKKTAHFCFYLGNKVNAIWHRNRLDNLANRTNRALQLFLEMGEVALCAFDACTLLD